MKKGIIFALLGLAILAISTSSTHAAARNGIAKTPPPKVDKGVVSNP